MQPFENRIDLSELSTKIQNVKGELSKVIVGQDRTINLILTSILANGHVLIEGVPGVAKTLTAKLVARLINAGFSRIQFTPDLMPSDVIGTSVYNVKDSEFYFHKGPLFSNVVLIDEINRAPAKTQSSLFEVMEERQITVDGHTYLMEPLYFVLATQNPIEQEGTYKLPEAQLDRFLLKVNVGYPTLEEEVKIIESHHQNIHISADLSKISPVLSVEEIISFREKAASLLVEGNLIKYIAEVIHQTRNHKMIYLGASPRASIAVLNASKAFAALNGRDFVTPEDIKYIFPHVLSHRIILSAEAEMEGLSSDKVVQRILERVEVPK